MYGLFKDRDNKELEVSMDTDNEIGYIQFVTTDHKGKMQIVMKLNTLELAEIKGMIDTLIINSNE